MFPCVTINFGPVHPAAHGVFRLILDSSQEVVITVSYYPGLLYRSTELLLEFRSVELGSGYFARTDYVAFFVLELGVSELSMTRTCTRSSRTELLLLTNATSNHILNLACSLVDAGLVSTLL